MNYVIRLSVNMKCIVKNVPLIQTKRSAFFPLEDFSFPTGGPSNRYKEMATIMVRQVINTFGSAARTWATITSFNSISSTQLFCLSWKFLESASYGKIGLKKIQKGNYLLPRMGKWTRCRYIDILDVEILSVRIIKIIDFIKFGLNIFN